MSNWHDMTPEQQAAQIESDYQIYGFSAFDVRSGERVDPSKVKPIMEKHTVPEDKFDPAAFFEMIRKSASVKAGAIMFGEVQASYYRTLKETMTDEEAFNLLALTTEQIIKSVASIIPPLAEVMIKAVAIAEMFNKPTGDKQVPGDE